MMIRKKSENLNYFQSENTQQISFQNEVKVRETLCDFEMKIAFRHFKKLLIQIICNSNCIIDYQEQWDCLL